MSSSSQAIESTSVVTTTHHPEDGDGRTTTQCPSGERPQSSSNNPQTADDAAVGPSIGGRVINAVMFIGVAAIVFQCVRIGSNRFQVRPSCIPLPFMLSTLPQKKHSE